MDCPKCKGTGKYNVKYVCYACHGLGVAVELAADGTLSIEHPFKGDLILTPNMILPFTNTHSKTALGKVVRFYDKNKIVFIGVVELNNVWFDLVNIKTGKKTSAPLHGSVLMTKQCPECGNDMDFKIRTCNGEFLWVCSGLRMPDFNTKSLLECEYEEPFINA